MFSEVLTPFMGSLAARVVIGLNGDQQLHVLHEALIPLATCAQAIRLLAAAAHSTAEHMPHVLQADYHHDQAQCPVRRKQVTFA